MRPFPLVVLCAMTVLGAAQCAKPVRPDTGMGPLAAGDATALIEGCGNQLVPGYTYCRVMEGEVANSSVYIVAPPAACEGDEPCTTFKIFMPTGEAPVEGSIPRGQTRGAVRWADLLRRPTFQVGDRGFWPVVVATRWLDAEGREQFTQVDGEIRVRVYRRGYVPLQDAAVDENFAYSWTEGGLPVRVTSTGRAYVGPR